MKSLHHALTSNSSIFPRADHWPELLTGISACPRVSLTVRSSFSTSASDVVSTLTTRTLHFSVIFKTSDLAASSLAMPWLARIRFFAQALANASAMA